MLMCLCGICSWTKSQIRARSHPNVLATTTWLNKMYHSKSGNKVEDVDLDKPLMYADRFRIRHPGVQWDAHPPHVDGTYLRLPQSNPHETAHAMRSDTMIA